MTDQIPIIPLTIEDIREWLIENRPAFLALRQLEFPPLNSELYCMYFDLQRLVRYYRYRHVCAKALAALCNVREPDLPLLQQWTRKYESLGNKKLFMFEVDFFDWMEEVPAGMIKIRKGLFTEQAPFDAISCFCKVFGLLFREYESLEPAFLATDKMNLLSNLRQILEKYQHPAPRT